MSLTVSDLLAQSRAHHETYRQSVDRRLNGRPAPDTPSATTALTQALEARQAAHDMDPDHQDPTWLSDRVSHDTLIAFYQQALAQP